MKSNIKRILAIMMVFAMMVGVMPNMQLTAHAAENYLTKAPENITLAPGESKGVSVTFAHRVIGDADWGNANISGRENGLDRVINFGANAGTEVTPYTFVYDAEKAGTTETYWLMYTCTDADGNNFPSEKVSFTVTYLEEAPAPTTSVTVTKEWDVPEIFDRADLPESVSVVLMADGESYGEPATLNDENNWTCTWTELPVATEDGTPIVYTVDEVEVPEGYEKTIGEALETDTGIEIAITNTLIEEEPEVPETVDVAGTKTWVGDEEADRPESIIVNLFANGEVIDEAEVTARTQWTFYFDELPECDESGAEITYSVQEEEVEGYTATYDGYNITNTLKEEEPEVPEKPVYGIVVNNGKSYTGAGVEISAAEEGTKITLKADSAPEGKEFDKWVVNNGTITLADATKAETTFDMPAERVEVTATYKDKVVTPPADDDNSDETDKPSDDNKEDESKPSDRNKPATDTESPKTGDTSNIFMWFAVLFVSGLALVGFLLFGKRRRA